MIGSRDGGNSGGAAAGKPGQRPDGRGTASGRPAPSGRSKQPAQPDCPGVLDRRLAYFVAVGRAGNISRAAERLGMSQPALSQAVRSLEAQTGLRLLRRTPRGVEPTEAGALLLKAAEGAERDIRRALDAASRPTASLVTGTNFRACGIVCTEAGRAFKARHPDVALTVRDLPGNDTLGEGIATGCEVVESFHSPTRAYPPGIGYRRILDAEIVMCVPPEDGLVSLDRPLEFRDLVGRTLCIYRRGVTDDTDLLLDALGRDGVDVNLVLCDDGDYTSLDYLVNGWIGPALSFAAERRSPMVALHMARPAYMEIGLFTVGEPSPAARAFVDEAAALFEERGRGSGSGVAAG